MYARCIGIGASRRKAPSLRPNFKHSPTPAANKDFDTEPHHNILVSSNKNTKTQPSKGYITMLDTDDLIGADNHTKAGENNRLFLKPAVSKPILLESFSVPPVRNENFFDSQHVQFKGEARATSSKPCSHKPTQNPSTVPTNFPQGLQLTRFGLKSDFSVCLSSGQNKLKGRDTIEKTKHLKEVTRTNSKTSKTCQGYERS